MKDILAQSIQIGPLQAKNRILMPPMYRPCSQNPRREKKLRRLRRIV